MLGPAFFVLLETSIKKGIRAALAFDLGVLTADFLYILIAYFFIHQIEELSHGEDNAYLRAIGGLIFITYGTITYLKKVKDIPVKRKRKEKGELTEVEPKDYGFQFIKGFLLNLANPLVVFYWFFVIASARSATKDELNSDNEHIVLFLAVVLTTFFTLDVLKIIGAKKLRPFITGKLLLSLNRITGSILIIFGIFLIINSLVILLK